MNQNFGAHFGSQMIKPLRFTSSKCSDPATLPDILGVSHPQKGCRKCPVIKFDMSTKNQWPEALWVWPKACDTYTARIRMAMYSQLFTDSIDWLAAWLGSTQWTVSKVCALGIIPDPSWLSQPEWCSLLRMDCFVNNIISHYKHRSSLWSSSY